MMVVWDSPEEILETNTKVSTYEKNSLSKCSTKCNSLCEVLQIVRNCIQMEFYCFDISSSNIVCLCEKKKEEKKTDKSTKKSKKSEKLEVEQA